MCTKNTHVFIYQVPNVNYCMSYNDSDMLPSNTYFSPLLLPQWQRISGFTVLEVLVDGNDYLKSFVKTLDNEIAQDQEQGREIIEELLNTLRTFGWCVIKPFDDPQNPYRVFSPILKEDWIKSTQTQIVNDQEVEVITREGCIFQYHDDLGNVFREECYWNSSNPAKPNNAYFRVWRKGTGVQKRYLHPDTVFALSDLDLGILSSAIAAYQVKASIELAGVKPFFLHFMYGESCSTPQANKVRTQMGYVGPSAGFAAKRSIVDEIKAIENSKIPDSVAALQELKSGFAQITRLPLSFFNGERKKGGLSESGEDSDEWDVMSRKEEILRHFNEICGDMLALEFGIVLNEQVYDQKRAEIDAKKDQKLLEEVTQKGVSKNEKDE